MEKIVIPKAECRICKIGILLPFSEFLGHNCFTSAITPIGYYICSNCGLKFEDGKYYRRVEKIHNYKLMPWEKDNICTYTEWEEVNGNSK